MSMVKDCQKLYTTFDLGDHDEVHQQPREPRRKFLSRTIKLHNLKPDELGTRICDMFLIFLGTCVYTFTLSRLEFPS